MMEADGVNLHGVVDQSLYSYRPPHYRNHIKPHKPYKFLLPADHNPNSVGLLKSPPFSLPPYTQQPPLLPLPTSHLRRSTTTVGHSYRNSSGTTRHHSFTAKKPTISHNKMIPYKGDMKSSPKRSSDSRAATVSSAGSGPLRSLSVGDHNLVFPGFLMPTISPPPSSLPLPTFSLRPKLSCNAVAAGEDTGATTDLRQLLRLG